MKVVRSVVFCMVALATPLFAVSALPDDLVLWQATSHAGGPSSTLIDKARDATRPFLDITQVPSDYAVFRGCVTGPDEGAMGVHYLNSVLADDGELDVNRPEALIYEFKGRIARLVGVEYIVMVDKWQGSEPPQLEGQLLQYNGTPNRFGVGAFYELHVWAWRDNPKGAFVDWNPRVSCEGQ